jgi:hypothetical protein
MERNNPMPERVPLADFSGVATHLTRAIKRPDGGDVKAFHSAATAQVEMRTAVNEHEDRLAALEARPAIAASPFPVGT